MFTFFHWALNIFNLKLTTKSHTELIYDLIFSHSWRWIQARRGRLVSQHETEGLWWYVDAPHGLSHWSSFPHSKRMQARLWLISYFWNQPLWNYSLTLSSSFPPSIDTPCPLVQYITDAALNTSSKGNLRWVRRMIRTILPCKCVLSVFSTLLF